MPMLKIWFADLNKMEVRTVEVPDDYHYGNHDSERNTIYENSHYVERDKAVERLRVNAIARVEMAGRDVQRAYAILSKAHEEAGVAASEVAQVGARYGMTGPAKPEV